MNQKLFSLSLAVCALAAGCAQPPVGFYETKSFDGVEFVRRDKTPILMDIFVPTGAPTPRPAVLILHGGGWAVGDRSYNRDMARFIASMGYTAATADYRLWPDGGVFPAPVQDSLAAVKFLRKNAADYGIDPDRIAICGESAGGHLALMVALAKDHAVFEDDSYPGVRSDVQAAIDIYGPTEITPLYDRGGWIVKRLCIGFIGCPAEECPEKWAAASPITYARADAPPVLILHGDMDHVVPYSQAKAMAAAIRKVGGRCMLARAEGGPHGWGLRFNDVVCQRTLPVMVDFLRRVFPESCEVATQTDIESATKSASVGAAEMNPL